MSKLIKNITKWQVVIGLQVLASVLLFMFVLNLGALPTLYLVLVGGLLFVLLTISFFLVKPSKKENKGKVREAIGKLVSVLMSVVLIVGSIYISQGNDVLGNITGAIQKTNRFNVYVLNTSEVEGLKDLTFEYVGMSKVYDSEAHYTEAHNSLLHENNKVRIKEYDDYTLLIKDLYDGKIKAICVNEAYNGVFEEQYSTLLADVNVIWSHDIVEQIIDISKNVNVTKDVFTIFVSGIDTTGKVSTVSRSDVNMLVTINPITKDILMTSIPRDYYVVLDNIGKKDKLTHAGLDGIENSVKTIENFMGIDINYYAKVNFTSLIKIVDALGGIDVYSDKTFVPWTNNSITIKKGTNHMNGKMALAFARERYTYTNGDYHRVQNQQAVLKAMLNKAMSSKIITNYSKLLKAIDGSFETNMTSDEIMDLIQMQLKDMSSWNFHSTVLTGTGKKMTGGAYMPNHKLYYNIPNQESIDEAAKIIKQMTNGEKISVE